MTTVAIEDDFDLAKITDSGQCFRPREVDPGIFRFITLNNVVYMRKVEEGYYEISCGLGEWDSIWMNYFDLRENYAAIRAEILEFAKGKPFEEFLTNAVEFSKGIRILRQDPFETLISFIISQRKNIPAIRMAVEKICDKFGSVIHSHDGDVHAFPKPDELSEASAYDLSTMSLGYRSAYVWDALEKIRGLEVSLEDLYSESDDAQLMEALKKINGVGDKISACVALYAYHRLSCVPVDVWIMRAIIEDFHNVNVFSALSANAGILQQYVFYYKRNGRKALPQ